MYKMGLYRVSHGSDSIQLAYRDSTSFIYSKGYAYFLSVSFTAVSPTESRLLFWNPGFQVAFKPGSSLQGQGASVALAQRQSSKTKSSVV